MPDFALRTLGGLALLQDGKPVEGPATQRKRLILLALVAAYNKGSGVSRDRVLGLLWPESDETRARNALNQALFGLRKELGGDAIVGAVELRLDIDLVDSDVGRLWRARGEKDAAAVVAAYTGPFLNDVYIAGTPDLNEWIERTRASVDTTLREALLTLARRADAARSYGEAVAFWQRLAAAAPLDASIACSLMNALAANGERASAVARARVYAALVSSELGMETDSSVSELASRLAVEPSRASRAAREAFVAEPAPTHGATGDDAVFANRTGSPQVEQKRIPPTQFSLSGISSRAWAVGAVAAAVLTLVYGGARRSPRLADAAPSAQQRDAVVFPFQVDIADSSLTFLGEGIADLLSASLAQQGNIVPADAHSLAAAWSAASAQPGDRSAIAVRATQRVGAERAILGTVVGNRTRINVSAEIISRDGKIVGRVARTAGPPDSLLAIVDRLAQALLAGEASGDARQLADLTTRSPEALRHYLRALSAVRMGQRDAAVAAFHDALHSDSTFALAALGIAGAGGWAQGTLRERLKNDFGIGWKLRSQLAPHEQSVFDAAVGRYNPTDDSDQESLQRWARAARDAPNRADIVYEYGDRLFHTGAYLGMPNADDQAARTFAFAVKTDSTQLFALGHLVELALDRRDIPAAQHFYAAYVVRDTVGDAGAYLAWRVAIAAGDADAARAVRARFDRLPSGGLRRIAGIGQLEGIATPDTHRALDVLLSREQTGAEHGLTLHRRHALDLNTANVAAVRRVLDALAAAESEDADAAATLGDAWDLAVSDALFSVGDPVRAWKAVVHLDAGRAAVTAATSMRHGCTTELWRIMHGDTSRTMATLRTLEGSRSEADSIANSGWQPRICVRGLVAELSLARNAAGASAAVLRLDSLMATGPRGFGSTFGNLWAARMLARIGEPARALVAATRRRRDWDEVLYLADMDALALQLMRRAGDVTQRARLEARLGALRGPMAVTRMQ